MMGSSLSKQTKRLIGAGAVLAFSLVVTGCTQESGSPLPNDTTAANQTATQAAAKSAQSQSISIPIEEVTWKLKPGITKQVWTYGGQVPGKEIRVKQGEWVDVAFTNKLAEPTSIHWHGYPVPNEMDGIPGITQPSIKPGKIRLWQE